MICICIHNVFNSCDETSDPIATLDLRLQLDMYMDTVPQSICQSTRNYFDPFK
jgi:hypothetical protein